MKKLILSISAMLFVGAISYAQINTSTVDQIGKWQTADVSQSGAGNTSEVYQGVKPSEMTAWGLNISSFNAADVIQDGNRNTAFISQNNWFNEATQTQKGDDNIATIWQDETIGGGWLYGGDIAIQTQTGNKNIATIDQGTSGNPIPDFFGNLVPLAPVLPHGWNIAVQTQTGEYGIAYASQGGFCNYSEQTQFGTLAGTATENISNHFQYGVCNEAYSTQTGWKNKVDVFQNGVSNYARNTQTSNGFAIGGNYSVVSQQGMYNISNVKQDNN